MKNILHLSYTPSQQLTHIFLWLVMLHSLSVGLALILAPAAWLSFFGFSFHESRFFVTQGGVFHIVMCLAYSLVARNPVVNDKLLLFAISAKMIATVFLFTYYLAVDPVLVILLSGIGDFAMGLMMIYCRSLLKEVRA